MKYDMETSGHCVIVRFHGRMDAAAVATLKNQVEDWIEWGRRPLLLNMEAVSFIDSTGLGFLVSLYRRQREKNGEMAICSLSASARTLFELTRMHRIFTLHDDEAAAIAALA